MNKRIRIKEVDPAAYKAMYALEAYMAATKLSPLHKEMIKIRASQINGCAYCINLHTRDARKAGETEQRIYALSAWRETPFFTEEERAILALTEEITLIGGQVADETYERAAQLFDPQYLSQIIMACITINAWTRISIATRMTPSVD